MAWAVPWFEGARCGWCLVGGGVVGLGFCGGLVVGVVWCGGMGVCACWSEVGVRLGLVAWLGLRSVMGGEGPRGWVHGACVFVEM